MTTVASGAAVRPICMLIAAFRAADPPGFHWREPPYEYEAAKLPIDILAGSPALRDQIEARAPIADIGGSWEPGIAEFMKVRAEYLLY